MFRIFRYFSIAALLAVCIASAGLVWFYRTITVDELVELGERSNLAPAQTALNSVQSELAAYLVSANASSAESDNRPVMPQTLVRQVRQLTSGSNIARIKIYGGQGQVVFSTRPHQSERGQEANPGFVSAINGDVASELVYRDTFNAFDEETEDDNLIQTYLPVREGPTQPIVGVFEIYTDVNELVGRAERLQIVTATGVFVVFGALYGFLLYMVHRARKIIGAQQAVIRHRSQSLEQLSAQLMQAQEAERKHIAEELHEGIAQTLSAVQSGIEDLSAEAAGCSVAGLQVKVDRMRPVVQGAIDELRKIAMGLRPSSLDDFGVVATIDWYCREFQSIYKDVKVRTSLTVQETDVTQPLKLIIFRMVQEALHYLVVSENGDDIRIGLDRGAGPVVLTLESGSACAPPSATSHTSNAPSDTPSLIGLRERVKVSGGMVTENRAGPGAVTLRMTWPV